MVEIDEIEEETTKGSDPMESNKPNTVEDGKGRSIDSASKQLDRMDIDESSPLPSEERILDANAVEAAAAKIDRPSARARLEELARKLRREGMALRRVEESRRKAESSEAAATAATAPADSAPLESSKPPASNDERKPQTKPVPAYSNDKKAPPAPASAKYVPIDKFAFDDGGYSGPHVTLYVTLPGVGSIPRSNISCDFSAGAFDLVVNDLGGKNYRLCKDNLDKDIDVSNSKFVVKRDKVLVKLGKIKSEYGSYDHWSGLTAKRPRKKGPNGKEDPSAGIMNLMRDMYEEGDDNMKKMIGETMYKQRTGQLDNDKNKPLGSGGLGGLGDSDFDL